MSQKAQLTLYPNRFQIGGPSILVTMVHAIVTDASIPPEELRYHLDSLFDSWHVICSVSGEEILLSNLKYWDVEKQAAYARPELVPTPECYKKEPK